MRLTVYDRVRRLTAYHNGHGGTRETFQNIFVMRLIVYDRYHNSHSLDRATAFDVFHARASTLFIIAGNITC